MAYLAVGVANGAAARNRGAQTYLPAATGQKPTLESSGEISA
jgi:hypothetical protein